MYITCLDVEGVLSRHQWQPHMRCARTMLHGIALFRCSLECAVYALAEQEV